MKVCKQDKYSFSLIHRTFKTFVYIFDMNEQETPAEKGRNLLPELVEGYWTARLETRAYCPL